MRRRIIICLSLLLAFCLVGGAISMWCLHESIAQMTHLAESHRIQSMRAELSAIGVRVEKDLLAYLIGSGADPINPLDSNDRFRQAMRNCASCHHQPSVQAELDAVHATFDAYEVSSRALYARSEADGQMHHSLARHDAADHRAQELAVELVERTTELADRAAKHLEVRSTDVVDSVHNAWIVLSGTLIAALIVGGLVAIHLERRLTRPIAALLDGIERARGGDRVHEFSLDADEEFQVLGRAFEQAYESLNAARANVLQAEKMAAVGRLAAGVAHEVGNPLASISSIAQVMRRRSLSDSQTQQVDLIMEEIERITRIDRDLVTFSRPTDGGMGDRIDVGALLVRATTLMQYDQRATRVELAHRFEALPEVWGNADQLLLVFTNVIINAFDAMNHQGGGSGTLTIKGCCEDDSVVIEFADNGSGMTEEQLANAFEPFFTTKEPGVGTGLGLWVCYRVVERHEGAITLKSRCGVGSTVTIRLPCDRRSGHPTPA